MNLSVRPLWMPLCATRNARRPGSGIDRRGPAAARLLLVVGLGLAGCDRAIEPYQPGERAEAPDLTRIFPEGAEPSPAQRPGMLPAPAAAESAEIPAAGDGAPIRGRITLAPEFEDRVPAGAILFLIARPSEGGPPLAVQRIADPQLPYEFSIGPEDRMIQQVPFTGPLVLAARLDADGNAMTREPGDLQGAAPGDYEPGASDVSIIIDEAL